MSPTWSSKHPYGATISENRVLNDDGSQKETRHIVVQLGDSGLSYKAGDALGFIPASPAPIVDALLERLGFAGDEQVETHNGMMPVREALRHHYEIHQANRRFVLALGEQLKGPNGGAQARLVSRTRSLAHSGDAVFEWSWSGEDEDWPPGFAPPRSNGADPGLHLWGSLIDDDAALDDYLWGRDYLDVLDDFPGLSFTPQTFIASLDRLKPRLYSIASSPDHEPGTIHLTVAIVRYDGQGRAKAGLCTGWLADEVAADETVTPVFISPTRSFVLPEDGDTDCIMVGPGTGIAPMRAFLQQRSIDGAKGRNWLFFGDQHERCDFLYQDELQAWVEDGTLDHLTCAWSRDQNHKIYVQTRMMEHAADIWSWIEGGAYFYVCGDRQRMAKDVHQALIEICQEHGGMSDEEAVTFVERTLMKEQKRYMRDVY